MAQTWDWTVSGGGSKSDKGIDMDIDNNGNIFVCGYFNSTTTNDVVFGPVPAQSGFGKQGLLTRLDKFGNWQWVKIASGGWDERVLGMCVDKQNGFVYVTGCCWVQTNFGTCNSTVYPGSADEIFVGKFDLNGNCQWLIGAGGGSDDHGFDVVVDKAGYIYLTGFISNEYSPTPSIAHIGNNNITVMPGDSVGYVTKITPAGNFLWAKTFKATDGERDNRIAIDDSANVYIAGGFWGSAAKFGNDTAVSKGGIDIFVVKFDSAGTQKWVRTAGSAYDDRANSVTVDKYGDVYVTGEFRDKVSFDGDTINNYGGPNGRDIFVAKIKSNGNWVWGKRAGSNSGNERGNRIIGDAKGNIYVTGEFRDSAKFSSQIPLISTNDVQVFVASIDTSGKWQWALQGGSPVEDRGNGLATDDSCNVYVCGFYSQTATFGDVNISALGLKDIFVSRITESCNKLVPPDLCTEIKIPTVFTPNGDMTNEYYQLDTMCIAELSMTIFNRWGKVVAVLSSPTEKWDGTINGQKASEGTYYYIADYKTQDGEESKVKGYFLLTR